MVADWVALITKPQLAFALQDQEHFLFAMVAGGKGIEPSRAARLSNSNSSRFITGFTTWSSNDPVAGRLV
jgi:hypothetical protein